MDPGLDLPLQRTLDRIELVSGIGDPDTGKLCVMSLVACLAGERHTDRSVCASPLTRAFAIPVNDHMPREMRQRLKPFALRIRGTNEGLGVAMPVPGPSRRDLAQAGRGYLGGPRRTAPLRLFQFAYSKVMAWVAFDRMVRDAETYGPEAPLDRWRATRDEIHATVCREGFDARIGSFTQSFGSPELDTSLLLIPATGLSGSRASLPKLSPLRTGRDNCSSSGSSLCRPVPDPHVVRMVAPPVYQRRLSSRSVPDPRPTSSGSGRPAHHAVDAGCIPTCVLLGKPADCEPLCGCSADP